MSIINNTAGYIITRGLGGPACCTLLTVNFGLACGCSIVIVTPPTGGSGGGGGSYAVEPGIYVPWPKDTSPQTRMVLITVKYHDKAWRRSFIIDKRRADIIIRISNVINRITSRINVGVDHFRKAMKKVIAVFKNDDK